MHLPVGPVPPVEIGLIRMLIDPPHSQIRRIETVGVSTPLIVPSFSSSGFPDVACIYNEMKENLYGVCLVSALDLSSGCIAADVTDDVNLVLVDSGMYEVRTKVGVPLHTPLAVASHNWSRHKYSSVADSIDPFANTILVNYDCLGPMGQQIKHAVEDFSRAPHAARDFLVKPESPSQLVNVARLATYSEKLKQFSIVGITAEEAGDSLKSRCRMIVMLRNVLFDAGLDLPIHVFGALKPLEVLAYFFCGADVFDGLSWLKLSFNGNGSKPIEEAAFDEGKADLAALELRTIERRANLRVLYRLQESMQEYCTTRSLDGLTQDFPLASRAACVAELAGAEFLGE